MSTHRADPFENRSDERPNLAGRLWRRFSPTEIRERTRQREHSFDDAQRIGNIKWQWRQACEVSGLGRFVYTPTGPAMSIPMIGRVELGPPTTFTVRLQPGQLASDVEAAGPRIAEAMSVAGIRVQQLPAEWVRVVLVAMPTWTRSADSPDVISFAPGGRARYEHSDDTVAA